MGLAVTVTAVVSVHPLEFVQIKLYVPDALKVVMVVVGLVLDVIVAVPGFPACAVQVPVPVPFNVTEPPGNVAQDNDLSVPASGFAVTTIDAVSVQPLAFVQMKL